MAVFTIPTLIIRGTADEAVPIDCSARSVAKLIREATFLEYERELRGMHVTANGRLNSDLLAFLQR